MARGLRLFTERTVDGAGAGQPVLDTANGERLVHVRSDVSIALASRSPESPGTLYLSTKRMIWLSDVDVSKGYALDLSDLSHREISRDTEDFPSPCIETQVKTGGGKAEEAQEPEEAYLSKVQFLRLIPSDPDQLDDIYVEMEDCVQQTFNQFDDMKKEFEEMEKEGEELLKVVSETPII